MADRVQVKAVLPRDLKQQLFAALAARGEKFTHWLRSHVEQQLAQWSRGEARPGTPGRNDAILIRHFQSGTASPAAWQEMALCILNAQGEWGKDLIPTILQETILHVDEYGNVENY